MTPKSEDNLQLERHVLFLDIVGYSKLLIEGQKERIGPLTTEVRASTDEQLVRLSTGNGMTLVIHKKMRQSRRSACWKSHGRRYRTVIWLARRSS